MGVGEEAHREGHCEEVIANWSPEGWVGDSQMEGWCVGWGRGFQVEGTGPQARRAGCIRGTERNTSANGGL